MEISGSILGIKEKNKENISSFINSGVDYVHLDVMDGLFVSNTSLPIEEVSKFDIHAKYDIHLMVDDVIKYVDQFKKMKPEYITFHYEVGNTFDLIKYIKKNNIKVGLSINPGTDVSDILEYLPYVDLLLIMSVEPGLGGQQFISNSLNKVDELYQYRKDNNLNFKIEIDGGIKDSNIDLLKKVDIIVVGSYITNGDYKDQVLKLRRII